MNFLDTRKTLSRQRRKPKTSKAHSSYYKYIRLTLKRQLSAKLRARFTMNVKNFVFTCKSVCVHVYVRVMCVVICDDVCMCDKATTHSYLLLRLTRFSLLRFLQYVMH